MNGSTNALSLLSGTIIRVKAAALNNYRVELPDGTSGYLQASNISSIAKPLLQHKINSKHPQLYNRPDSSAAVKMNLKAGQTVNVLGNFGNYELVLGQNEEMGWIKR
jgi:SH3-like domain-containing protein